nr:hypothetical protein [Pseudomonas sp. FW305-122]
MNVIDMRQTPIGTLLIEFFHQDEFRITFNQYHFLRKRELQDIVVRGLHEEFCGVR